ncbi:YczE/YyaS/YitT family protein [Domibacillus robiginosus]|uniref:YczE/YyaS/YitT family protein n=1 Tax=Domibacillus robiginosus TaxID=1071054 RepID=UPI00067D6D8B|nr:hypothetical protein [Domibacillus robiginosus]
MTTFNCKLFIKRMIIFILGLNIINFGVAIFINLGIGADPFTIFSQGVANLFNLNIGDANRFLTLIICIIVFLIDKKNINIGTILSIGLTGTFLNLHVKIVDVIFPNDLSLWGSMLLFVLACLPVSIGFPVLKSANLGIAPNDIVYLAVADRLSKSYGIVRIVIDAIFVIVGIMLGGVAGIGTIICVIILGPLTQHFLKKIDCAVKRFLYISKRLKTENNPI